MRRPGESRALVFRRRDRLTHEREYARVFEGGLRRRAGPLTVHGVPNGLGHHRLGLSVPRRVGGAVQRHAVKRRIREAFRLHRGEWPMCASGSGLDLVVQVRPHTLLPVRTYAGLIGEACRHIVHAERRRAERGSGGSA